MSAHVRRELTKSNEKKYFCQSYEDPDALDSAVCKLLSPVPLSAAANTNSDHASCQ